MNIIDVIYSLPTWLLALIIVSLTTGYSVGGLLIIRRRWPWAMRPEHCDLAQVVSSIAGVMYALILGFVTVAVWQGFDKAQNVVELEASAVGDLIRTAHGYPDEAFRRRAQDGILAYVGLVIKEEWPLQQRGQMSERAEDTLETVHRQLFAFDPKNFREHIIQTEALATMRTVMGQRRTRALMNDSALQPPIWVVIVLGAVLGLSFPFFSGVENFRVHLVMTVVLAMSMGLVLFMIVALDFPFRGTVSITPEPFQKVLETMERFAAGR